MEQLVDAQLLEVVTPGRYRLHDVLYLFAQELVAEEPEAARRAALERERVWWVKGTLAQDFEVQAEWRDRKAEEWPEDAVRNLRAAEGLHGLAGYVRQLPYDDPKLRRLAQVWFSPNPDEGAAQRLLEKYGFAPVGLPDHDSFLTDYAEEWSMDSEGV